MTFYDVHLRICGDCSRAEALGSFCASCPCGAHTICAGSDTYDRFDEACGGDPMRCNAVTRRQAFVATREPRRDAAKEKGRLVTGLDRTVNEHSVKLNICH